MADPLNGPRIVTDDLGVAFYECPVCDAKGTVPISLTEKQIASIQWIAQRSMYGYGSVEIPRDHKACDHCGGFGRVPVPSWYVDAVKARRDG